MILPNKLSKTKVGKVIQKEIDSTDFSSYKALQHLRGWLRGFSITGDEPEIDKLIMDLSLEVQVLLNSWGKS